MKKIYMLNNSNGETGLFLGLKSRITSIKPVLTMLMLLTLCGFSTSVWGQKYNGGTWYSLYDTEEYTSDHTFNVVPPTTEKVTFEWKKSARGLWGSYNGFQLNVWYSTDGSNFTGSTRVVTSTIYEKYAAYKEETKTISGSKNAVKIEFRYGACTRTNYFQKVRMPMKKHIWLQKSDGTGVGDNLTKDFGKVKWEQSKGIKVNFRSFLTCGNITVKIKGDTNNDFSFSNSSHGVHTLTSSDANKTYAVGSNRCASQNAAKTTDYCSSESTLGNAANYDFTVYFYPKRENSGVSYSNNNVYVEISDGTTTAYVYLRGTVDKRNQTIQNFSTTAETHWTSDAITAFAAYTKDNTSGANTNLTVEYSSNNTSVATVDNTGKVTIIKDGTVTFTAKQTGNAYYNSCTSKSVTWTITKVTPTLIAPVISSPLKYNETCPVGTKVKDYWTAGNLAKDNEGTNVLSQDITGAYSCEDLLLPAKNAEGYLVTFTPSNTNWYNTNTIRIYREVEKGDQYITWDLLDGLNPRDKYYEYATGEAFDATSYGTANDNPTGLTVSYSSSNPAFATIVDGNKLNVVKANEVVTITATCVDPAGNWNDAVSVTKTFKTCGAKPDNWSVTASALTYGQLLSESALSGVVRLGEVAVPGTLEWVVPTTMPNAGNHSYSVLFTPENEDAYGSVTFEVPVTVAKADPLITWNIGERLRENSRYSNFVVSTNTEAALNTSVSNTSLLSVEGNVLTTDAVTGTTNGWIKVSQPASANYNAVPEQTLNVTINPKSTVCLPLILDENKFNDAKESSVDKVSWCSTNEEGTRENYIAHFDVRYTQRVGIALGSWDEGLSGLSWTKFWGLISGGGFEWSPKSVDLAFTGVPDKISFDVESQEVTSSPPDATWKASATDWYLYESADGVNYTQVGDKFVSGHQVRNRQLKVDTRYIRIKYSGNFTGFVKNLQITQKKYLNVDKPTLTFGTEANPLQEPQEITLSYSSLGYCGDQNSKITVTSSNPAFYVDESEITENVDIDQMGEYTIRVRCNDVNQSGKIVFEAYDGTKLEVPVSSAKPVLTASSPVIFKTGTEHAPSPETLYRTLDEIGYAGCFEGAEAKFDTLYIYGVSESAASSRAWEFDASKGYNVPAIAAGNLHTPCFVYAKNGSQYDYKRTFDATTTSLNIQAAGKKLGFIGYKPAGTAAFHAIQLNGAANEQTEVYLNNVEIGVNGSALVVNNTEAAEDAFAVKVYARGTNILQANAAAVQLSANKAQLTIEDSWKAGDASAVLALRPGTGNPSIDLGGAKGKVIINGTQIELHNATNMAIVHMNDTKEETDGEVKINDGTILGDAILGLPHKTLIDGGTFNAGDIKVYKTSEKVVRALNSRNEVLGRQTTTEDQLPEWYGKAHLTLDGDKVHPMLFGGEGLCVFDNSQNDHQSNNDDNWTEKPSGTSDAIITENMDITDSLTVNSLTINEGVTVTVANGATLSIGDGDSYRTTAGNLHVENGGNVILHNGQLNVNDFILDAELGSINENTSTPSASGQVMGEQKLNVSGDAYFRLTLDPLSGRNTLGWYDFVLPFEVDVIGGISMEGDDTPLVFDVNYAVMNYTEAKRAQNGKDWNKYRGTMEPGRIYTIGVDDDYDWNTVIFKKKAGAAVTGDRSFTTEYSGLAADDKDNGWNGFGNGTLHHTELNVPDSTYVQIYDHANRCYRPHLAKDYSIAVGASFFMQVDGVETISLLTIDNNNHGFLAPARTDRNVEKFQLALQAEGAANVADQLWVSASEEATGKYVIGRDLLKMGNPTESKVARMWSTRNDTRLCVNEMTLSNGVANCELSLFAPEAKEYTLSVEAAPEEATLYLTCNNRVIWNLSYAPYVFDLSKGTTEGYGLRLVAEAPQMHTDIDETGADAQGVKKVMIDNVLYLVTPQGAMYDINGKIIK